MSGVKGRSGRTSDPEARRARQMAGRKGGLSRGENQQNATPTGDDWLDLLPGVNPYDRAVSKTKGRFTYLDARSREQSNGELLNNERKKHELDLERGRSLSKDAHRAAVIAIVEAIISDLSPLTDAAVNAVPPESQPLMRHTMDLATRKLREAASERIKALG
jgi:hypothetical protein